MTISVKIANFSRSITRIEQAPRPSRPAVVFAGRSNVGKSSLINALTQKKGLARTSNTPGRTQEIIYFDIDEQIWFVDLPGYGYAKVPEKIREKWGPMIEAFLKSDEDLRLVVIILDVRRDPSPEDLQMIEWLGEIGRPYIFAVTKADKVGRNELQKRLRAIQKQLGLPSGESLVPFSSLDGTGRKELLRVILDVVKG